MNRFLSLFGVLVAVLMASSVANASDTPRCNAANSWEVFPDHSDCSKFFRCEHNRLVEHTCVENTLFDKQLKACNWDKYVDCSADETVPASPVLVCPRIEDDPNKPTHLEHPTDCGKFYKCWDGTPVEMDCPKGFLWNQVLLYCDFPINVPCGNVQN